MSDTTAAGAGHVEEPADVPPAELVDLHIDQHGLDFRMRHPIVPEIGRMLADAFRDAGGTNYVSFEVEAPEIGPLLLTMQRRYGATPAALAARYRAALEAIVASQGDARQTAAEALREDRR